MEFIIFYNPYKVAITSLYFMVIFLLSIIASHYIVI